MTNVLIVTYYFPPEGGPAVQRIAKFVKYLPEYGYNPIVLTSKHPIKVVDADLGNEIDKDLVIYRTKDWISYLPGEITRFIKKVLFPDKQMFWAKTSIKAAQRIIKQHNIKLIFTSSPPHSIQILAYQIHRTNNIPFIVDLRDEWSGNPDFGSWLNPSRQMQLEKSILSNAAQITTISLGAVRRLSAISAHNRVSAIFNGFDPIDFPTKASGYVKNDILSFTYGGRLSESHSPQSFLTALNELIKEQYINPEQISVTFWGNNNPDKWVKYCGNISSRVRFLPYLSHSEYIKTVSRADILLLFATKIKNSDVLTGKVFEYMYLQKPICAQVEKECELNSILAEYGNATVNLTSDNTGIKATLIKYIEDWKNDRLQSTANQDFVNGFTRKNQTKQLADIFKSVLK